ncbi:MAG TPA: NAD(P)(+) transhydrogenase (Re/Si-specific) subunit beta [Gemmatimonadaceae bacterium]
MNGAFGFTQVTYLAAAILFIIGLRSLTRPDQARRGMRLAAVGMLLAIVGTLVQQQIVDYRWIAAGLVVGGVIGYPLGMWVPMTAMPQRIAIALSLGAFAATLVGVAEYWQRIHGGVAIGTGTMIALGFEVMLGALTVTGAFIAFGKLQEFISGRPVTYKGQNVVNGLLALVVVGTFVYLVVNPTAVGAFFLMIALSALVGVSLVMPIGGADMPVVIALLNSYAGLASAATGFALDNNILIICGALDGASGFILSVLMSKAMNRSFGNIIFGAFGAAPAAGVAKAGESKPVRSLSVDDAAIQLAFAPLVIVVPGYGMAVAQAQHQVRELAELIEKRGGEVKFAIHPVAGRMPGHMNVLLAEANVPYDKLYDMDEINAEFDRADVALVIGANDVVNPAARSDPQSPIYGMPILDVDRAKSVIVMKRGMAAGFAGIENELFHEPRTAMLFGDAKGTLVKLIGEMKAL